MTTEPQNPYAHIRTIMDEDRVVGNRPTVMVCCIGEDFLAPYWDEQEQRKVWKVWHETSEPHQTPLDEDNTWDAVNKACSFLHLNGYDVAMQVIHNVSVGPNVGVPAMRNWAAMTCLDPNAPPVDYLLMVDNDFLMDDPTTIYRLVKHGKMVTVPWYDQTPVYGWRCQACDATVWEYGLDCPRCYAKDALAITVERVAYPMVQPKQGLVPLDWISINCVLFSTMVFRTQGLGTELFTGPLITNKEDYVFTRLRINGVRLWQDTDVSVKVLRAPTRTWQKLGQDNPNPSTEEHRQKFADLLSRGDRIRAEFEQKLREQVNQVSGVQAQ